MGILVPIRPLSSTGREPGTMPGHDAAGRGSVREQHRAEWENDVPLALANLSLARQIAGRPLATRAALQILKRTSTRQIPELGKRQSLQNDGLFVSVGSDADGGGLWDLTDSGTERLRASGRSPALTPETIRTILRLVDR